MTVREAKGAVVVACPMARRLGSGCVVAYSAETSATPAVVPGWRSPAGGRGKSCGRCTRRWDEGEREAASRAYAAASRAREVKEVRGVGEFRDIER